jgi:hypothetical protein
VFHLFHNKHELTFAWATAAHTFPIAVARV